MEEQNMKENILTRIIHTLAFKIKLHIISRLLISPCHDIWKYCWCVPKPEIFYIIIIHWYCVGVGISVFALGNISQL